MKELTDHSDYPIQDVNLAEGKCFRISFCLSRRPGREGIFGAAPAVLVSNFFSLSLVSFGISTTQGNTQYHRFLNWEAENHNFHPRISWLELL